MLPGQTMKPPFENKLYASIEKLELLLSGPKTFESSLLFYFLLISQFITSIFDNLLAFYWESFIGVFLC